MTSEVIVAGVVVRRVIVGFQVKARGCARVDVHRGGGEQSVYIMVCEESVYMVFNCLVLFFLISVTRNVISQSFSVKCTLYITLQQEQMK